MTSARSLAEGGDDEIGVVGGTGAAPGVAVALGAGFVAGLAGALAGASFWPGVCALALFEMMKRRLTGRDLDAGSRFSTRGSFSVPCADLLSFLFTINNKTCRIRFGSEGPCVPGNPPVRRAN